MAWIHISSNKSSIVKFHRDDFRSTPVHLLLDIISKTPSISYVSELSTVGKHHCHLANGSFWGIWASADHGLVHDRLD